eukprot:13866752-Heterocapsa_arctica.AAC.1
MVMPPAGTLAGLQAQGLGFGPAVGGAERYAEDLRELKGTLQDFKHSQSRGRGSSIKKAKKEKDEKRARKISAKKTKKEKNGCKKGRKK